MTDLSYCYLHMTDYELKTLDTLETPAYLDGLLLDDDMVLPPSMIPPNPEEHDTLPSQTHPSYPFGNPTHVKHPASRPRLVHDPTSRSLFEDMGFGPATVDVTLRWKELALDQLLPSDESKQVAEKAIEARKMASGVPNNPPPQYHAGPVVAPGEDEEDSEHELDEEEEDDEEELSEDEDEDEDDDDD
ncbi:hypothetical protein BDZ89DRAFT_1098000 [Hymenopellis radicata]|nr:hypothetical protein BDZ89DRAFT_1098000 [Hymenopellis radicata]